MTNRCKRITSITISLSARTPTVFNYLLICMGAISLIILNWKREENVINNVRRYALYRLIDQVIIFNNNGEVNLKHLSGGTVTVVESSADLGLFTRFAAAGLAKNACIMHCDDDLFVPEETVDALYKEWFMRPDICHGLEGRLIFDKYNRNNVIGDVHVVLTRCLLVSKRNCLSAFTFSLNFQDLPGEPAGNGEDIILSYVSMHNGKQLNRTYRLPYQEHNDTDQNDAPVAIFRRWRHHLAHRTMVVNRCKKLLFKIG